MIGQTISHYKILEKLGEGGMGVVYKAHDTELDRDVALKFLPHHITANESEQARFLQEARAAALLNHPNICTVHAIEKWDDEQFIVMEYVDGNTLREAIQSSIVNPKSAIEFAIQIGEALQEAHGKGIVHRDIKLDNIMVNSKNQIKVMDFGLAKLKGSLKLTRTSSTVGTLAYMAPEQIQGGQVDARSDIFSFGVVLYEMLTGQMPFRGEHEAAMVYSIVNEEPVPIQKYLPDTSSELVHILNRALEKNPEERYQTMHDMLIDLRRLKKQTSHVLRAIPEVSSNSAQALNPQNPKTIGSSRLQTKHAYSYVGTGLILLLLSSYFLFFAKRSVELNPEMTSRVLPLPFARIGTHALSPDGNWIVYAAEGADRKFGVYLANLAGGEPKRITTPTSTLIVWVDLSSDGGHVVYDVRRGDHFEIWSVTSLGSDEKRLFDNGLGPVWRPDGERIFFIRGVPNASASRSGKLEIWSGKPDGSDERLEFIDSLNTVLLFSMALSPDGNSIAWIRTFSDFALYQEIFIRDLASGKERQLTFDRKNIGDICWARNGQIIYSTNKGGNVALWMVSVAGGTPSQITKEVGFEGGIRISADNKRLVYGQLQIMRDVWLMDLNDATTLRVTNEGNCEAPTLSPHDKTIACNSYGSNALSVTYSIDVLERDGTNRRQVKTGEGWAMYPSWSPDGQTLAYVKVGLAFEASNPQRFRAHVTAVSGRDESKYIAEGLPQWVSSDEIVAWTGEKSWLVSLRTSEKKQFYIDSTNALPVLGGKYILYQDSRFGNEGIWIVSAESADALPRKLLSEEVVRKWYGSILSVSYNQMRGELVYRTTNDELWKMHLPDGRKTRIQVSFREKLHPLAFQGRGNEIVYSDYRPHSRLILLENPFK